MNSFVDDKFIRLVSSELKHFKQKSPKVWNFRCPFCLDSKKHQHKARGYIFYDQKHNGYFFKCWNCSQSANMFSFLKHVNTSLYRQYVWETFANKKVIEPQYIYTPEENVPEILLESLSVLPINHWVMDYIRYRKIPEKFWKELFYAPDYAEFISIMKPKDDRVSPNDPRLIIPIWDENYNLQGINARALKTNGIRYIVRKFSDDAIKLYGLHRVDKSKKTYVFEGPLDSLFIENAVATCDSDLLRSTKYISQDQLVLVFDKDKHNKEILNQIQKSIDFGCKVCLLPKYPEGKDINQIVINGYPEDKLENLINENTFSGLRARTEFHFWKGL